MAVLLVIADLCAVSATRPPTWRSNVCIKRVDNRTVRNVPATAFCDHRLKHTLKPAQVGNLTVNRLEMGACLRVNFTASQRALVNQPKHGADFIQAEAEFAASFDDVTGRDQFVYMAAYGAKIAAKNALNSNSFTYDNSAMPAVVFTDPQVASVGLTEAEAKKAGHAVKTSVIGLDNVPRALAAKDTRGLIKLVADQDSKKLLGAHILAPEGADSIQTAALAIKVGMTVDDLGSMIFPYLTTVEGLKLAAQTFDKDVSKLSCCAG